MDIELKRRRFTVDEYHRMGEVGILPEDERVELIEGEILEMSPIGSRHAGIVNRLNDLFTLRLRGRAIVAVQNPISLGSKYSEPQPDLTLLRPRADYYADALPEPPDILLVVEVMDTSVKYDRRLKLPLYARAGISEVWLLDLNGERVEVCRRPALGGYRDLRTIPRDDSLAAAAFPEVVFTVADLLG